MMRSGCPWDSASPLQVVSKCVHVSIVVQGLDGIFLADVVSSSGNSDIRVSSSGTSDDIRLQVSSIKIRSKRVYVVRVTIQGVIVIVGKEEVFNELSWV